MKSSIAKNSIWTFGFSVLGSGISVLTGIFLAKTLGPSGKGLFSGIQVLQSGIAAITGGAAGAITYMLTNQRRKFSDLIRPLALILAAVTILAWVFLAGWGLRFGISPTLLVAAAVIPASIVISWRSSFYVGLGKIRNLNYQGFALTLATLITVVISVQVLHFGVVGAITAWSICVYCSALIVLAHALSLGGQGNDVGFWRDTRTLIRFGSRAALDGLIGFLNYRIDSLVLIAYLGASGYGVYSTAVAGGELLFMISRPVGLAAAHDVASLDMPASAALTAKSIRMSTFVVALVAILLAIVGPSLITAVYGPKFEGAGTPLRILLVGIIAYASAGTFSSFFVYRLGRPMAVFYVGAVMIAIQLAVSIALIPRLGLIGAAIGSTVTYLFAAVAVTYYFSRITKVSALSVWVIQAEDFRTLARAIRGLWPAQANP